MTVNKKTILKAELSSMSLGYGKNVAVYSQQRCYIRRFDLKQTES